MARGVNSKETLLDLVTQVVSEINKVRSPTHTAFRLERKEALLRGGYFGRFRYEQGIVLPELKAKLSDDDFASTGYSDSVGGPLNTHYNNLYWNNEIVSTIRAHQPEDLVLYLRKDPKYIAARILLPITYGYDGLTSEEIVKHYGEDMAKKMDKNLMGVTVSRDSDGQFRFPFRDLEYAYKCATGQAVHPEEWD